MTTDPNELVVRIYMDGTYKNGRGVLLRASVVSGGEVAKFATCGHNGPTAFTTHVVYLFGIVYLFDVVETENWV